MSEISHPIMRRRCKLISLAAPLTMCLMLTGCGGSRPSTVAVHGRVTLDGKPVDQALITFIAKGDTKGPNAVGLIELGQYELDPEHGPVVGTLRVEIRPAPIEDEPPPGEQSQGFRSLGTPIPAQFNTQSRLEAETKAERENEINFDLTTTQGN